MIPAPTFAAAVVTTTLLIGGTLDYSPLDYSPHILTLRWADGTEERVAATSREVCDTARRAVALRYWPVDEPAPVVTYCAPGYGFAAGAEYIKGFNAPLDVVRR